MEKYGRAGQATDDNITRRIAMHAGYLRLQTHAQDMKYFVAFPQKQWLRERASLRYT